MEPIVQGLANNNYVVGVANTGGIIAFLVLLYGFLRWAWRFAKSAYHQNVRVAFYRARRRRYIRARRAALDLHTFISIIVIRGLSVAFGFLAVITGLFAAVLTRYVTPPEERFSSLLHIPPVWDRVIGMTMMWAPLFLTFFVSWRLIELAWTTRRVRAKLIRRKWRLTSEAQQSANVN